MKKKILCLAMSLALVIAGCSKSSNDPVIANVGDNEITMSQFQFYLNSVKQQMQGTELSTEEDWQTYEIDGKKAIDVAKEQALDIALNNIAYIQIFEKMGNKIDDAAKEEIKATKDSIVSQYEQNGGYEAFLTEAGITDEFVDLLCESMYCSDRLYETYSKDNESAITEEEINQALEANGINDEFFASYRSAKHVLILTQDQATQEPYDEEKKAEAKATADDVYKRALDGEDFDFLIEQYNEDPGVASQPEGYTFTDGEMVQEFQDCVDSLEIGAIGFTETSYGYHIIKKVDTREIMKKQAVNYVLSEKFVQFIEEKINEYGITLEEQEAINEALKASTSADAETEASPQASADSE